MNSAAANRARVAQFQADRQGDGIGPGMDGLEVRYLRRVCGPIAPQGSQGHTEFKGGWATAKLKIGKGAG